MRKTQVTAEAQHEARSEQHQTGGNHGPTDEELLKWRNQQRKARRVGRLSQYKIDKLNAINFDWDKDE